MQVGELGMTVRIIREVGRPEDLTDLGFALPAGPVLAVDLHEAPRPLDRFGLRLEIVHGVAADDFLGFRERAVEHRHLACPKA